MNFLATSPRTYTPDPDNEKNLAVMMSGGVDSSVTALLLKQAGWNIVGITMKIPYADGCDYNRSCCGTQAAYVCNELDIPHYFLDVQKAFVERVIEPFRTWYEQGRTPSPCVDCNTEIKFDYAWSRIIEELGVEHLATGHYARIIHEGAEAFLARGEDPARDQSYFLYGIKRERLPKLHLPLSEYSKPEVREIARSAKLPVASRQDSMELCFAGQDDYRNALGKNGLIPGPILNGAGEVIGTHSGIANFTVGQRKGINIPAKEALFVSRIDPAANSITVAGRESLFADKVQAGCANVIIPNLIEPGTRLFGKIRSQGEPEPCEVLASLEDKLSVRFEKPVYGPTPGQRLVVYDERARVVAGGVIE